MKYLIIISVLVLSACSSTPNINIADTMNVIALSEQKAPKGVFGTFKFLIKGSGTEQGYVYLNTEMDYRDRRAITVVLTPKIISDFTKYYGSNPADYFVDKFIEVKGEAKREKISIYFKGTKSSKYYFQTHINVTSLDQIKVLG